MGPGRPRLTDSARKRSVSAAAKKRNLSRIPLGKFADRWNVLGETIGVSTSELIQHLLDVHESLCGCDKQKEADKSKEVNTPSAHSSSPTFTTPECVQVETPHFNNSFESLAISLPATPPSSSNQTSPHAQSPRHQEDIQSEIEAESDSVYNPNLSDARATFGEDSEDRSTLEEDLLQLPSPAEEDEDMTVDDIPDHSNSLSDLITAEKFVVYLNPLMDLVKRAAGSTCSRSSCKKPLIYSHRKFGTSVHIKWVCSDGHTCGSWASQPRVKMMFAGNLQLASSILFSGNSYRKVALLFKFFELGCLDETTFYQVQKHYAAPAVDSYWQDMQTRLLLEKSRQGQPVCLAGDGRNDSPGHSAQYCTYSFLDIDTEAVLHLEVIDVRQATSSVAMEKVGFTNGLDFLQSKVDVAEIVTDQSPSISKIMRTHPAYQSIDHQFDIWHANTGGFS